MYYCDSLLGVNRFLVQMHKCINAGQSITISITWGISGKRGEYGKKVPNALSSIESDNDKVLLRIRET